MGGWTTYCPPYAAPSPPEAGGGTKNRLREVVSPLWRKANISGGWSRTDSLLLEGWARDGLTDEQIAHNMGITAKTLYVWKSAYGEICEAPKRAKKSWISRWKTRPETGLGL